MPGNFVSLLLSTLAVIFGSMTDVTLILCAIDQGDPVAAKQLLPLVYDEFRILASQILTQEKPGQTLDATALVHEAYLRLVSPTTEVRFSDGRHFFMAAAEAMRRILVENARRKGRLKHGGGRQRDHADLDAILVPDANEEILALHEALEEFAAHDPIKAKLVELRCFGGLTLVEAAQCLDISPSTADRAWRYARAWLYEVLNHDVEKDH